MVKKLLGHFTKKSCKKTNRKESREKVINYVLNGKIMIINLIVGLIKNILLYNVSYFPEIYTRSKNKITVEFDLSNYVTKSNLKNATGVVVRTLGMGSTLPILVGI